MIHLRNVSKIYNQGEVSETAALKQVNFDVEAGDFIAVMGPSGSGKSTLLNVIGCMDRVTEGEIWIGGTDISNADMRTLHQIRKNYISFVFQNFALMNAYTVEENVELPLLAQNMPRAKRRQKVAEQLEALGISRLAKKYPPKCSGGQQQRAAIARAMAADRPILLADEPTGALDQATGEELMELFVKLNQQGKTIVVITHDPHVASYAKRIVRIVDGQLFEE